MSEQEVQALKEQIKRELLAEMNTKKENENSCKIQGIKLMYNPLVVNLLFVFYTRFFF